MEKCGRVGEATDDMTYAPFTLRLQTHTLYIYIYIYIFLEYVFVVHTLRPIYIFITSRLFTLRMKNVSDKRCRESQNIFCAQYLSFQTRAVYEKIWKHIVEPGRPQTTICRMRIAYWIPKAKNTHTHVV